MFSLLQRNTRRFFLNIEFSSERLLYILYYVFVLSLTLLAHTFSFNRMRRTLAHQILSLCHAHATCPHLLISRKLTSTYHPSHDENWLEPWRMQCTYKKLSTVNVGSLQKATQLAWTSCEWPKNVNKIFSIHLHFQWLYCKLGCNYGNILFDKLYAQF